MTPALGLAVLLLVALTVVAFVGPVVLAAARPHLVAHPRVSIAAIGVFGSAWIIGLVSAGPAIAWAVSGPAIVPGVAGAVCQQCLVAANPFSSQPLHSGIPSAALLGVSVLVIAAIAVSIFREFAVRRIQICRASRASDAQCPTAMIAGVRVRIVATSAIFAFALPARCGGITLSRGAVELLDPDEQRAVVAHEAVHLDHRHHLIAALAVGVAAPLRWVPYVATCTRMILELLEIDADAGAQRATSTTVLVSALVKLQTESATAERTVVGTRGSAKVEPAGALFALGDGPWHASRSVGPSARVRSLLGMGGRPRLWPTAGLAAFVAPVTVAGTGVHIAGAVALLSGCAIV